MIGARSSLVVVVAAVAAAAAPGVARADKVDDLIAILDKKPAGMSNDTWREKRREAARELGRLGDKRAVEPLMRIAENEKFDAIGEIAIEALGKLGDKRAVPVLKKIAADESREPYQRESARESLAALGEPVGGGAEPAPETPVAGEPAAPTGEAPVESGGGGDTGVTEPEDEPEPLGPVEVPQTSRFGDVMAQAERWTFGLGSFAVAWDSVADQPQASGRVSGGYHRGLEKPKLGYSVNVAASFLGGAQDRDGAMPDSSSYSAVGSLAGVTEARVYLDGNPRGFFVFGAGNVSLAASSVKVEVTGGDDFSEVTPSFDVGLGLGVGAGRTLDVGARLRVQRIEAVLRRARLLGRPINADVAGRLQTAWWNARGALGLRTQLAATVQILREAGVLLQDPDPTTTYQLLQVLGDSALDQRLSGWDVRVGVGEIFVGRDNVAADDDFDVSRQEALLLQVTWARQLGPDTEIVATGRGAYRLTGDAAMGQPKYLFAEADVAFRRFFYADTWDPRGALELGADAGWADLDLDADDAGQSSHLGLRGGWTWTLSRATRLSALGTLRLEGDERFLLVELRGTFALSPASYAAW
jgi:hypothetical protein